MTLAIVLGAAMLAVLILVAVSLKAACGPETPKVTR
jgi:hypothetical protein